MTRERFAAILTVGRPISDGSHVLSIRARVDGVEQRSAELARFEVVGAPDGGSVSVRAPGGRVDEPLIAICMATHEPSAELFARQIESIRGQSHRRFLCIVSDDCSSEEAWALIRQTVGDDSRFVCSRSEQKLGHYRNFERALRLVPVEARLIALSDQDDLWYPEKLETLEAAIARSGALLACSDMRIVDSDGRVLASSYWADRRPNSSRLASLLLMNTVTGASSMFRYDLLADVLPFPPDVGRPFHDHWIAAVALALGRIEYIDRPLYEYVQHGANVVGSHVHSDDFRGGLLHALRRFAANPRGRFTSSRANAQTQYMQELLRVELFARTLELRLGDRVMPACAAELQRLAKLGNSMGALLWLLARSALDLSGAGETLGAENQLLKAILWKDLHALRIRTRDCAGRRIREARLSPAGPTD